MTPAELSEILRKRAEKYGDSLAGERFSYIDCKIDYLAGANDNSALLIAYGRWLERTESGGAVSRIEKLTKDLEDLLR